METTLPLLTRDEARGMLTVSGGRPVSFRVESDAFMGEIKATYYLSDAGGEGHALASHWREKITEYLRLERNYFHAQADAMLADEVWQSALVRKFKGDAGNARYDTRGYSTPNLKKLSREFSEASRTMSRTLENWREFKRKNFNGCENMIVFSR